MNIKKSIEIELWVINDMRWLTREKPERIFAFHNASLTRIEVAVTECVKELEAQVPRVVKPEMKRHISGPYYLCSCNAVVDGIRRFNYCPDCGAKLDWEIK